MFRRLIYDCSLKPLAVFLNEHYTTPHYMPQQENFWLHQLLKTSHDKYFQIAQDSGNDSMLYCSLTILDSSVTGVFYVFKAFTQ